MTSPSPSEPSETPSKKRELPPSKTTGEAIERLLTLAGISVDAGWTFMDNGIPRKLDGVRELMLELLNAPSPELQRTGEAKELCSQIATRYKQMIQRRAQDDDDILGDAEMQTLLECALEELSTHYESREAQLREWRPIRTAPTDGTLILLYILNAFGFDHVKVGFVKGAVAWSRYFDGEALGEISESGATHWMPLPATPAMKTPEQD
jgi:hypothetical protein